MAVSPVSGNAAPQIAGAIRDAARTTGISFEYLLTTARIESNLNPSAQAPTSSARGLYQFIDQTWLGTMKQAGPAFGLGTYANAISQSADGRYEVADPGMRAAIMRLRSDPAASAMLAGALTRSNSAQMSAAIGRQPSEGELYIAHFLGPDGAARLVGAASQRPQASAAAVFPQAAAANPSIFYDRSGSPRSVSAVYGTLTGRFDTARNAAFDPRLREAAAPPVPPAPIPDPAGTTQALAAAAGPPPPVQDTQPLFQGMFTDRERTALAPAVNSLWGAPRAEAASGRPLDLFSDGHGDVRKLFGNG